MLTFLRAVTVLACAVVVLTELLGAFGLLRRGPLVAAWCAVAVLGAVALRSVSVRWLRPDGVVLLCAAMTAIVATTAVIA